MSIHSIRWLDAQTLGFLVNEKGTTELRKFDLNSRETSIIFRGDEALEGWAELNGTFYFTASSVLHPSSVWKFDGQLTLIEEPNAKYLETHLISIPEELWIESPTGRKIQAWFFKPHTSEGNPPLALHIHGGPHVMWTPAGTMWHEFQCFTSAGYAVLATNPHGSDGYGEEFRKSIVGEWGEKDYIDLESAVDFVLDRVDSNRLYILGGSYGWCMCT